MSKVECPRCGWENLETDKGCLGCGTRLDIPYVPNAAPNTAGPSESMPFKVLAWLGVIMLVVAFVVAIVWVKKASGHTGGLFDSPVNTGGYLLAVSGLSELGLICLIVWYLASQHVLRKRRHQELMSHLLRLEELTSEGAHPNNPGIKSQATGRATEG
jgi:hypothetical protein